MTTIDHDAIARHLSTLTLVHGKGAGDHVCSVVAVNLAVNGTLTDDDPSDCMSPVVRRWIITVQDAMPEGMMAAGDEHGDRWLATLPFLAGSRDPAREQERLDMILAWMWERLADRWRGWVPVGAHKAWAVMLTERTAKAARADVASANATYAARAATATATATAAYAGAIAANAAAYATANANANAWRRTDPAGLLARLLTPSSHS